MKPELCKEAYSVVKVVQLLCKCLINGQILVGLCMHTFNHGCIKKKDKMSFKIVVEAINQP